MAWLRGGVIIGSIGTPLTGVSDMKIGDGNVFSPSPESCQGEASTAAMEAWASEEVPGWKHFRNL